MHLLFLCLWVHQRQISWELSPSYGVQRMSPVVCRPLFFHSLMFLWTTTGPNSIWYSLDDSLPNFLLWPCLNCKMTTTLLIIWKIRNLLKFSSEPVDGINWYQIVCAWSLSKIFPVGLVNSLNTAADPVILGFLALS